MVKKLRYWGAFYSQNVVFWRVEIWQKTDSVIYDSEIFFPIDPLIFEWSELSKIESLHCSSATLTIESDEDRRFLNLYQVEVGAIELRVYRNGDFYWSGTLDTELYEEPFAYKENYDVTLTFSDFGILDRKKWDKGGFMTIQEVITECLTQTEITYNSAITKHISTKLHSQHFDSITLNELSVLCENFYDEDGEPMTTMEVLKGVLQPLSLRLVQKGGKIIIYDLNAIHKFDPVQIVWAGTDAALGVDKAYNNVLLTFSPYADTALISGKMDFKKCATDDSSPTITYLDLTNDIVHMTSPEGFSLHIGSNNDGVLQVFGPAKFFRLTSQYSGDDCCGVVTTAQKFIPGQGYVTVKNLPPASKVLNDRDCISEKIFSTKSKYLPNVGSGDFKLKISLDLMFDVKYNPFEEASIENEEHEWQHMKDWCNYGYVPVVILLRDANGTPTHYYSNSAVMASSGCDNKGEWRPTSREPRLDQCYLAYYDQSNRKNGTGFGGWSTNRPIIGWYDKTLPSGISRLGNGEYIPYPPSAGWLEVQVGSGVHYFDNYDRHENDLYSVVRWVMYKDLTVELVHKHGKDLEPEDVEYSAWLNRAAKDGLTIDTIFGVTPDLSPSARGQIYNVNKTQLNTLHRGGVTDVPEKLLIGTAYSQYASRCNTLSGTIELLPNFAIYSDKSILGKYLLLSEVQNVYRNESEIAMCEFNEDNYNGVKYE